MYPVCFEDVALHLKTVANKPQYIFKAKMVKCCSTFDSSNLLRTAKNVLYMILFVYRRRLSVNLLNFEVKVKR